MTYLCAGGQRSDVLGKEGIGVMKVAAMATLECHCGNVSLKLPNPVPKARCGCCCVDCLQRAYIGSKGLLRSELRDLLEPVDLIYVDSQIMRPDATTKSRLSLFRLNDANSYEILEAKSILPHFGDVKWRQNQAK